MNFKELSPWIMVDHCATRVKKGDSPNIVDNRVCFIEKTPRVRVLKGRFNLENTYTTPGTAVWISGPKGDGTLCGLDKKSRAWCDTMLKLLGWE